VIGRKILSNGNGPNFLEAALCGVFMISRLMAGLRFVSPLFLVTVALPALGAGVYYGVLASDVYISESKFVVRSPDKPAVGGVGILLKTAGFSNASDELHATHEFIRSRDALTGLNKGNYFQSTFSSDDISIFDRFGTFNFKPSFEDLYSYFQKKVNVRYDSTSSITTLTVRAYAPGDAQKINQELLAMAEQTVNRLNQRGRQDLINTALAEVNQAKSDAGIAAARLARYRNRSGIVDPAKQAEVQLQMVSKLQDELIANRTQLAELRNYAPSNPQVPALRARIESLQQQVSQEVGKVVGGQGSLAGEIEQYQALVLEDQFASKRLAASMAALQEAEAEARRKHAYVERIAHPSRPDEALEPYRWRGILAALVLGCVAWGIVALLFAGVREHRD
jgi:capsular polysaccharide transport system permease protein